MPGKNYYQEISEQYRLRREAAEERCNERKSEVYAAQPLVRDIDIQLSSTGAKILAAAKDGGDVEAAVDKIRAENDKLREKRAALLVQSGFPADFTDMVYTCPRCHDSGFVGLSMCECMKIAVAEARLADTEIGSLAAKQRFDNFSLDYYKPGVERENIRRALEMLRDFANKFTAKNGESWLLLGDTGLGKTHLSTSVGATVIRRGYDVVYRSAANMIDDFEKEQFRGASYDTVRKYFDCDLLIIDDLGSEMTTAFTVSCLYNVINSRMNADSSTLINTNLTQSQLRERYTDRIASRLFGEYRPIVFRGTDIRRQKLSK